MRARVVQVVLLFVAVIAACSTTDTRATVRANTRRSLWGTGQSSPALDSASSTETTTLDQCAIQSWNPALDALLEPDRARGEVAPPRPWDHATDPRYMDRVQQRFVLSDPEMDALQRQGFVVPDPSGHPWDGNVAARLLYKMIGWMLASARAQNE